MSSRRNGLRKQVAEAKEGPLELRKVHWKRKFKWAYSQWEGVSKTLCLLCKYAVKINHMSGWCKALLFKNSMSSLCLWLTQKCDFIYDTFLNKSGYVLGSHIVQIILNIIKKVMGFINLCDANTFFVNTSGPNFLSLIFKIYP